MEDETDVEISIMKSAVSALMGPERFKKYDAFKEELKAVVEKHHVLMDEPESTAQALMSTSLAYVFVTKQDVQKWCDRIVDVARKGKAAQRNGEL